MKFFSFICALLVFIAGTASAQLRVLTYNIHHGEGLDGKLDLARIAKVIADQKPDLVALQEVDNKVARSGKVDQAAELAKILGMHHAFGSAIETGGGEYGNAVLSRFPIKSSDIHKLPGGPEPRIALAAQIELPAGHKNRLIGFISVHLDHTGQATSKQAGIAASIASKSNYPVILAGDFNATRTSHPMIEAAKFVKIAPSGGPTFPAKDPKREIDFITASHFPTSVKTTVVDAPVASDHRPVLGVFEKE